MQHFADDPAVPMADTARKDYSMFTKRGNKRVAAVVDKIRQLAPLLHRKQIVRLLRNALCSIREEYREVGISEVLHAIAQEFTEVFKAAGFSELSRYEFSPEPRHHSLEWPRMRNLSDIAAAEEEFHDKVWYNRRLDHFESIEQGLEPSITADQMKAVREEMRRVEELYDDLGPWDDFDWGMINGKLSALRWLQGLDWDTLDT